MMANCWISGSLFVLSISIMASFLLGTGATFKDIRSTVMKDKCRQVAGLESRRGSRGVILPDDVEFSLHISKHNHTLLICHVPIFTSDSVHRDVYIIDADTWTTIENRQSRDLFKKRFRNIKPTTLLVPYDKLRITNRGSLCFMENNLVRVMVWNSKNTWMPSPSPSTYQFNCDDGHAGTSNAVLPHAANALYLGELVHTMFQEWVAVNVTKKFPITIVLNFEDRKSYWDGENVRISGSGIADDGIGIIGHELGHAFNRQHTKFRNRDDTTINGISESFSDVVEEAAKFFLNGNNSWTARGDDYRVGVPDMCNEAGNKLSMTHISQYKDDRYYLAGLFNRVACLVGKTSKWGVKKVFQIFVQANRFYWITPKDYSFERGGCGLLKATFDLDFETETMENALSNVGISPCDLRGHARKPSACCPIANIEKNNNSYLRFHLRTVPGKNIRVSISCPSGGDCGNADLVVLDKDRRILVGYEKGIGSDHSVEFKSKYFNYNVILRANPSYHGVTLSWQYLE